MHKLQVKRKPNRSKPEFSNPMGYAFVIGNGTSRRDFDLKPLMDYGILFGCNYFYRDMHPHVLVLSDEAITSTVAKVDKAWMMRNHVYSWYPKNGGKIKKVAFPEKTSAGLMAVYEAIETFGAKKIFLVGMDFFGLGSKGSDNNGKINNMYAGKKHYQSEDQVAPTYRNWQRRFQYVLKEYPDVEFYHVAPLEGKSPERLIGAPNWHQVSWDNLQDHLNNDVDLIDIKTISHEDEELFYTENPDNLRASIERQFSGQENFIYPDKIDPNTFLKLRLEVQNQYRQTGFNGNNLLAIKIKEFTIQVPPVLVKTPSGLILASDEFIVKSYQKEAEERYGKMGIKLEPFRKLTSGTGHPEAPPSPGLAPPPPPPSFGDIPPPPPPPVF